MHLDPELGEPKYLWRDKGWYDEAKRCIDVFGSGFLLALFCPLMATVALLIKATSAGPVFYTQTRLTKAGRIFTIYKFRTMRTDAEAQTGAVLAESNDPRITRIGKLLRLTRIDELPQLINVLIGDMSLIGPRPERPEIAEKLAAELPLFHRRLEVNAGLTGLAQVDAGYASEVDSYKHKLDLDIFYVDNRSFVLDVKILWRTIFVTLSGSGAR